MTRQDKSGGKVITVTYGAFSCTLEGFDDPLETLKVVAEYFRDLSAHDRYFASEPAKLDPEALAHIAQQEVDGTVQVTQPEDAITLSARPGSEGSAGEEPEITTPSNIVDGQSDAEVEAFFSGTATEDDESESARVNPIAPPAADNSIEEKLQRIRRAVAQDDSGVPPAFDEKQDEPGASDLAPQLIAKARAYAEDSGITDADATLSNIFDDTKEEPADSAAETTVSTVPDRAKMAKIKKKALEAAVQQGIIKDIKRAPAPRPRGVEPYLDLAKQTVDVSFSKVPVPSRDAVGETTAADTTGIPPERPAPLRLSASQRVDLTT
jgi:hypothetical protein